MRCLSLRYDSAASSQISLTPMSGVCRRTRHRPAVYLYRSGSDVLRNSDNSAGRVSTAYDQRKQRLGGEEEVLYRNSQSQTKQALSAHECPQTSRPDTRLERKSWQCYYSKDHDWHNIHVTWMLHNYVHTITSTLFPEAGATELNEMWHLLSISTSVIL